MQVSAHDLKALAVVEWNTPLPLSELEELTLADPLWLALKRAWENRKEREEVRTATICAAVYNAMRVNNQSWQARDFLQKEGGGHTSEEDTLANFVALEMALKAQNKQPAG